MDDITYGGFIPSNIKRSIVRECFESGDPVEYWRALRDVVEKMDDDIEDIDDILTKLNKWADELHCLPF